MNQTTEKLPRFELSPEDRQKVLASLGECALIGLQIEDNFEQLKHGFKDAVLHPIQWSRDQYFNEDYKRQKYFLEATEKIARLALEGSISVDFYATYASLAMGIKF